ncbi:MAG: PQQ-binding-like beta-propeller repeat protein [Polyangiales bacterium]
MSLSVQTCPQCGAAAPNAVVGQPHTCVYCGSVAVVKATGSQPAHPQTMMHVPTHQAGGSKLAFVLGGVAALLFVAAGIGTALMNSGESSGPSATSLTPPPAPALRHLGTNPDPIFEDLDGDGSLDLLAYVEHVEGVNHTHRLVGYDGATGALRLETRPISLGRYPLITRVGMHVLIAGDRGQLVAYDLGSGDEQWTATLTEEPEAFCENAAEGAVLLLTADERTISIDLATQVQTVGPATCVHAAEHPDPEDRRDWDAPFGVDSYKCGTTRLIGSRGDMVLPDACAEYVDASLIEDMRLARIWQVESEWLLLGSMMEGRPLPMVGVFANGAVRWHSEVQETHIGAGMGLPRHPTLMGDSVVVGYVTDRVHMLSAFALEDGARRWTRALDDDLNGMAGGAQQLFAHVGSRVLALDPASGETRLTFGDARP